MVIFAAGVLCYVGRIAHLHLLTKGDKEEYNALGSLHKQGRVEAFAAVAFEVIKFCKISCSLPGIVIALLLRRDLFCSNCAPVCKPGLHGKPADKLPYLFVLLCTLLCVLLFFHSTKIIIV